VLFTGSSIFIARADVEMPFVRDWIGALRASADPTVRDLQVLVRPHPYNGRAWNPDVFAGVPGVAVWPRGGYDPVDEASRAGLFDSLFYCDAVVGINTSAMIEAAIVGRPVLSIETPQFAGTQDGTLHYRYLLPENGGFLRVATSFDDHVRQLGAVLADPAGTRHELQRFVHAFIRPQGLEQPSMPRLVEALERYGQTPAPAPVRSALIARVARLLLAPLTAADSWLLSPSERRKRSAAPKAPKGTKAPTAATEARASVPSIVAVAATAPILAATILVAAFVVAELAGHTPFAYSPPRNAAEAAGMGMAPEIVRFLREGENPVAVVTVRPDIISSAVTRVTAGEAAVWSRRGRLLMLVDSLGGIPDQPTRTHLACLAGDIGAAEVVAQLWPAGAPPCHAGETLRAIEARAR
jgi:hypothetical protein